MNAGSSLRIEYMQDNATEKKESFFNKLIKKIILEIKKVFVARTKRR
jgi:hypothetical protein